MPSTWVPIESVTLTSPAGSVTLGSGGTLPQNYTDLILVVSGQTTRSGSVDGVGIRFNGDTATNYSITRLTGNGSSAATDRLSNTAFAGVQIAGDSGSRTPIRWQIQSYSSSSVWKTSLVRSDVVAGLVTLGASLWRSTAAITSLTVLPEVGPNFAAGSTFSLYAIKSAAFPFGSGVQATGGDEVYTDGTYKYHVFKSSGLLTVLQGGSVDYLVVAGGGGGGYDIGGGGGGGGYRCSVAGELSGANTPAEAPLVVASSTSYSITVGAGGVSTAATTSLPGGAGSNSSIGTSVVSLGGGGGRSRASAVGNGGSGGGGTYAATGPGSGTAGQGSNGGTAASTSAGAGGGGAGEVGQNTSSANGGRGGNGITSSITGSAVTRAGGGGGGAFGGTGGVAGSGGGGRGGDSSLPSGANGEVNTGGGGGGEHTRPPNTAGAGGSGIVIVRYPI